MEGRFWEQGMFAVAPKIATVPAIPEKLNTGLNIMRDFMHSKGIIFGNEPGSILVKPLQNVVNAVMFVKRDLMRVRRLSGISMAWSSENSVL